MTVTDSEPTTISFALPAGQTDTLLAALRDHDPTLPVFVYERIDPATRDPITTYIGLRVDAVEPDPGEEPFAVLRRRLDEPGAGGAASRVFGFVAYPQGEHFAARGQVRSADTPRAVFLTLHDYVMIDHRAGVATVVGTDNADGTDSGASRAADWATLLAAGRPTGVDNVDLPGERQFDWAPAVTEDEFSVGVDAFKDSVAGSAAVGGVVLSVQMTSAMRSDPLESYRTLRRINPSTVMFLLRHGDFALWGATSLSMVEVQGRHLVAETDGATQLVPALGPGEVFTWKPSAKEVYEYDVVASALHDDLVPVSAPGTLTFTRELEHRTFYGLSHLFAEVQADLAADADAISVVEALFPHGAAVGHPRREALQIIDSVELVARGPFSGAVGMFGGPGGGADVASVTRSMWTNASGSFAQAGAKVVPASVARAEYEESILKTKALRTSAVPYRTESS